MRVLVLNIISYVMRVLVLNNTPRGVREGRDAALMTEGTPVDLRRGNRHVIFLAGSRTLELIYLRHFDF